MALLAWSGRARSTGIPGFFVLACALLAAVWPRVVERFGRTSPTDPAGVASDDGTLEAGVAWRAERSLRIACAGAAVAIASLVHGGVVEGSLVAGARLVGVVAMLGGIGWLTRAVSEEGSVGSSRVDRFAGVALALAPAALLVAAALGSTSSLARGWTVLVSLGLCARVLVAWVRAGDPFERARLTWLLGASSWLVVACAHGGWVLARAGSQLELASPARAVVPTVFAALLAMGFAAVASAGIALERADRWVRASWLGALGAAVGMLTGLLRTDPWVTALGAVAGGGLLLAWSFTSVWEPRGGALLRGAARASAACVGAERIDEFAALVLAPLREASGELRAPAALWVPDEESRFTLDVSGAAHRAPFAPAGARALLSYLRARGGPVASVDALRPLVVRRPELHAVLEALDAHEAFAALALAEPEAGGLAAVLLVPRGRRRARLNASEALALQALSVRAARALAITRALERARDRASVAERVAGEAEEAKRAAEAVVERARAEQSVAVVAPGSLRDAWIAYSAASRGAEKALQARAVGEGPVQIIAEPGCSLGAAAAKFHALSPRARGPRVHFDAAAVHPRDAERALDGDGEVPGWIARAQGGTLCIENAQALGADATGPVLRLLRGDRGPEGARLLLAAPGPLRELGAPAELTTMLPDAEAIELPPLRAREEDLEPLALLALDRACRLAARSPLGLSREALAALRSYAWPGNERELFDALERAAARAKGERVVLEDLPASIVATAPVGASGDAARARSSVPPVGEDEATYEALERRILETALERTGGNKSEAARALGLARTTFLDKLRKHGLRE